MSENENAGATTAGAPQGNGMATASLVLGIVSIVLCWIWFIGIIAGILAIVLAVVSKKKIKANPNMGGSGAATGGLVTGIIGTLIALVFIIIAVMFVSAVAGAAGGVLDSQEFQDAVRDLENLNNNNN